MAGDKRRRNGETRACVRDLIHQDGSWTGCQRIASALGIAKTTALFTAPRRRAIYGLVAAGSIALVAFGVITQDQIDQAVLTAGQVVAALAAMMALLNTGGAK